MKDFLKKNFQTLVLTLATVCASGICAIAQTFPNGLSANSVQPVEDSIFISRVRARLDSVRTTCGRPTVALVLGGGGAKGSAEAGVLKYLEEQKIPVDFICGTSIGGLIAGLYSIGYTPDEIMDLFKTRDWGKVLSDRIDTRYYPYSTTRYRSKYCIYFPFHYEDEDKLGPLLRENVDSFTSSIPSGYAYGFNVNNLFSALTVGFHDRMCFADMPVPYACVAADLVSLKAKYWGEGLFKTALRSTMSIPGLFEPVKTDGMTLIDGGARNNLPSDLAKAVGADIVIGVDLSSSDQGSAPGASIVGLATQLINMLDTDSFNENVGNVDLLVQPDVTGYNMLSFNSEAIDTLALRGYSAAKAHADEFGDLRCWCESYDGRHLGRRAVNILNAKVLLGSVEFRGTNDMESRLMQERIGIKAGEYVDAAAIDEAMCLVQAAGCFRKVTYSLLGREEPYRLVFDCEKGPVHQFGVGLRMDTRAWVSAVVNLGLNAHKLMGSKLDMSLRIGQKQALDVLYSYDRPYGPTLNAGVSATHFLGKMDYHLGSALSGDNALKLDASYWTHREALYVSNVKWRSVDCQVGLQNRYYKMGGSSVVGNLYFDDSILSGNYTGLFFHGNIYTLDDPSFPTKGLDFNVAYDMDFFKAGVPSFKPVQTIYAGVRMVIPVSERFSIVPDLATRLVFVDNGGDFLSTGVFNPAYSLAHSNFAGGVMKDRYIEGQVPYFGSNNVILASDKLCVLRFDFRWKLGRRYYVSAVASGLFEDSTLGGLAMDIRPDDWAIGVESGFSTVVGPIKANVHWDRRLGLGAYASIGFDF